MGRTTIHLDPAIVKKLKHLGADTWKSVSRLINHLLRGALREDPLGRRKDHRLAWNIVEGGRPAEGFDPASRDYLDLMDNGP